MYKVSLSGLQRLLVLISFIFISACGGGGGSTDLSQSESPAQLFIAGGGIKGPLAFASVELYALDMNFNQLYDSGNPIASAVTNAYAEITGLPVPTDIAPPYVMVIDGTNAIDRNTGVAPVISRLMTIITKESLDAGQPIYATPYTTLAYQMLALESRDGSNASEVASVRVTDASIGATLAQFNRMIINSIGFSLPAEADIFTTSPLITADTDTIEEQQLVVHHRAAMEAFSAMLYGMSLSSEPRVTADSLLQRLALDLYSDNVIDNSDGTHTIGAIDTDLLSSDPILLEIPNTQYLVQDIISLMDDERALIGNSGITIFFKDDIDVSLGSSSLDANQVPPLDSSVPPLDSSQEIGYSLPVNNSADALIVAAGLLFNVDFENRATNSTYTEAQIIEDFNANSNDGGIQGPQYGNTTIVSDPAGNTGRGNVIRILHRAGEMSVGASFKARFAPDNQKKRGSARFDDVYFAYDMYLPSNTVFMPVHKTPGLITGTLLQASHLTDRQTVVEPEGIDAFSARMSIYSGASFPAIPSGGGALVNYAYDAQKTRNVDFLNTSDPGENIDNSLGANVDKMYMWPTGRWVTVEQRVKMNTADSNDVYNPNNDLKDGLIQVWVDGELMLSRTHLWRWTDTMKADGFWFTDYYNNRPELASPPPVDQYTYYDNFRVSTSPITPRR